MERLKRVRLAVAAIQRQHQLGAQMLPVGVIADQRRQPPDDVGVAAESEVGLDLLLERGDAQLVQALDLGLGERLVGDIGQGGAAPQRESALERAGGLLRAAGGELAATLGDQPLEAVRVESARRSSANRSRARA